MKPMAVNRKSKCRKNEETNAGCSWRKESLPCDSLRAALRALVRNEESLHRTKAPSDEGKRSAVAVVNGCPVDSQSRDRAARRRHWLGANPEEGMGCGGDREVSGGQWPPAR